MKKILIIGNDGYVGPILTRYLKQKYYIYGVDTNWFKTKVLFKENYNTYKPQKKITKDLRQLDLKKLNFFPDAIVYLAAISNDPMGKNFSKITHDINTKYCEKIALQAKHIGVKKFIFASSCSIYGAAGNSKKKENHKLQPLTDYAKSKVNSEKLLKKISSKHFKITSLRFATAAGYSPKLRLDLVLNDFVANGITNNKILILSDGKPWRPLIHVKDMSRAIKWSIEYKQKSNFLALNIGSDKWTFTIEMLAKIVAKELGGVEVKLNSNSQPDKRSYTVDFALFKKLCKNYQPKENINKSIRELANKMLGSKLNFQNFRNSRRFIRLKNLIYLQKNNKLSKNLYWKK